MKTSIRQILHSINTMIASLILQLNSLTNAENAISRSFKMLSTKCHFSLYPTMMPICLLALCVTGQLCPMLENNLYKNRFAQNNQACIKQPTYVTTENFDRDDNVCIREIDHPIHGGGMVSRPTRDGATIFIRRVAVIPNVAIHCKRGHAAAQCERSLFHRLSSEGQIAYNGSITHHVNISMAQCKTAVSPVR